MSFSALSYRRIAVELAALSAADRDWLLARLPTAQRKLLEQQLLALSKLRVDVEVIRGWNGLRSSSGDALSEGEDGIHVVDGLPSQEVASLLADWPSELRETFLGLHPWKWLSDLPPTLQPNPLGRTASLTTTSKKALVKAVAAQVARAG